MKLLSVLAFCVLVITLTSLSGCGAFMGNLRRDLDDSPQVSDNSPTVGGAWAERGFLSEDTPLGSAYPDRFATLGHSDRSLASDGSPAPGASDDSNSARDGQRSFTDDASSDGSSFSQNPNLAPQTKRQYKNGDRATRSDFVDESPNEGSLWASDGQTNYYFTKNKIRSVGDIITITLEDAIVKDIGVETKRSLSQRERELELGIAQDRLKAKYMADSLGTSASSADRSPAGAPGAAPGAQPDPNVTTTPQASAFAPQKKPEDAPVATFNDIDLTPALEVKTGDTMMAEIVERYPNGNYKIRGLKKVPYKNGPPRLVSVVGVVQNADIDEAGLVKSGKLYEYRLQAMRQ